MQRYLETFCDAVCIYVIGGLAGTVYEVLLNVILHGVWEDRSGSILTPCNGVYGLGALIIFLLLYRLKKLWLIYLLGAILGGIVEYGFSICQELLLGSRSWDYSELPLNINGRTTIPYMLVWGLLCVAAVRVIFPAILWLWHRLPLIARKWSAIFLVAVVVIDLTLTATAVIHYSRRVQDGYDAPTRADMIDELFNDDYMRHHFPNMKLITGEQNG